MEVIGFVLIITAIIYGVALLADESDNGIKSALKVPTICEVLFIIFVLGAGLFTNWK